MLSDSGEMASDEDPGDLDGEPIGVREALAVGEDFQDLACPVLEVTCGDDADGLPVNLNAIAVGFAAERVVVAVPRSAWHRKVAKRMLPKGFLNRMFGAEVAAISASDRYTVLESPTLRVWLGFCDPDKQGDTCRLWRLCGWRGGGEGRRWEGGGGVEGGVV